MGRIQAEIKVSFGKIVIEGSTPNELLEIIGGIPENFFRDLENAVSEKFMPVREANSEKISIVKYTEEGPVLVLKDPNSITHCEAIGLLLYFSKDKSFRPSQMRRLLKYSGLSVQISSRLNEMLRKGLVFKPSPKDPRWALTPKGERWVEEEILPRLAKVR